MEKFVAQKFRHSNMGNKAEKLIGKPVFNLLAVCVLSLILSGCSLQSSKNNQITADSDSAWLQSGSLMIARSLPSSGLNAAQVLPSQVQPSLAQHGQTLQGFMPQTAEVLSTYSLRIMRSKMKAAVYHGAVKVEEFSLSDIEGLEPGDYTVVHKQRHPVWYANDAYFINRGLAIPAADDRTRYLKGALGEFVIFLDEQTPIHNSLVWADDVGGIRISDNHIAKMYYQLDVGALVTIE